MRIFRGAPIAGVINYYHLEDWWLRTLTDQERELILKRFPSLVQGSIESISQNSGRYLLSLASWFRKSSEDRSVARKILNMSVERARHETDVISEHLALGCLIEVWYRDRDTVPDALDVTIDLCKAQIAISNRSAAAFKRDLPNLPLPTTHRGFQQLLTIYEKQGRYNEAIEVAQLRVRTGWAEDMSQIIERLQNRITKRKK